MITIGRIVHYSLSEADVSQIARQRSKLPIIGNTVRRGDILPLIVTTTFSNNIINGQAILDGLDTLWVTSVKQGYNPGEWNWPPIVKT